LPLSDADSSERLSDFATQYEYAIVTGFNYAAQVRHRGAGIFLHVNGTGPTAGCVSAPRWFLRRTMAALDPDLRPVIAIGR
jgi:L,D-peptidoglycan transpeptidase YkuD (ErfK/YbiS/YcfS/YnhG family)